jgi:lipopolysaccharide/colanic/teichoic acid biosynthesis glycosyltransferase
MSLLAEPEFHGEASRYHTRNSPYRTTQMSDLQIAQLQIPHLKFADLQVPCSTIAPAFAVADAGAIVLANLLGAEGYQLLISGAPWNLNVHIGAGVTAAVLYLMIGRSFGFYQVADILSSRRHPQTIVWQWLLTGLLLTLLALLFRISVDFSQGSIICFAGAALASLLASRSLMKSALASAVRQGRVQGRRLALAGWRDELTADPAFPVKRSRAIEIQRPPLSGFDQAAKRALDIVVASLALIVLSPMMLLTAFAVQLESPGPALFRQQRTGFNARRFLIFKFRTMTVMEEGDNVTQATRHDPRVTGLGSLLRASSIDELPQLFNVLLGDMSLVGPRPHAVAHDSYYGKLLSEYAYRHHVKPGITGWAQIQGCRGPTVQIELMKNRLDCDLWYINNWSLALDLLILAGTVVELLRPRNAY